jgi:putative flippase GtrA
MAELAPTRGRALPRGSGALLLQWLRFAVVGAANTLLSWCVYAVLEHVGVHYLLASGLAFVLGAFNSYVLNRRWTFHSQGRRRPEAVRFGVIQWGFSYLSEGRPTPRTTA